VRQLHSKGLISKKQQRQASVTVEAAIASKRLEWLSDFEGWLQVASTRYKVVTQSQLYQPSTSDRNFFKGADIAVPEFEETRTKVIKREPRPHRFQEPSDSNINITEYPNNPTLAINVDDRIESNERPADIAKCVTALVRL